MAFKLVQRLEASPDGVCRNPMGCEATLWVSKFILDAGAKVDLAYMGSSEFEERSTLVGSANRIAVAANELKIVTRQLVRPTYSEDVHFICTDAQSGETIPQWGEWTKDPQSREPTGYFRDLERIGDEVVGWWALNEDIIWTREADVAEDIRGAFVTILDNVS